MKRLLGEEPEDAVLKRHKWDLCLLHMAL
jgi:hypothetical protein